MRFRLAPMPAQEQALLEHCAHARYVWNLAVEQHQHWRPGRKSAPGYVEQSRQLTQARKAFAWLAAGSQTVQQQALRDFAQAMAGFFAGTHRRPTWRKAGVHEGFRIVGKRGNHWDVRRLSRKTGEVWVAKVGWVRFRWSRPIPEEAKSFRVYRDRAGRWHVAFAVIPPPVDGPGTGQVVGVDRGVAVSAALSTGERLSVPGLRATEATRLPRLQRRLARAKPGSKRRARVKTAIARIKTCSLLRVGTGLESPAFRRGRTSTDDDPSRAESPSTRFRGPLLDRELGAIRRSAGISRRTGHPRSRTPQAFGLPSLLACTTRARSMTWCSPLRPTRDRGRRVPTTLWSGG
ncbi:MAG: RNA-guided endonuclease InsQ/TnpB family protein [Actinoallomurus sp.]